MDGLSSDLRLRDHDLTWREIDGEVVAVDVAKSAYLSSNPAGSLLWSMLASGARRDGLANRLVEAFGIDRARAESDVDAFLRALDERGLLAS
jgi:hypothetical protein